jgi:hypothetical protein
MAAYDFSYSSMLILAAFVYGLIFIISGFISIYMINRLYPNFKRRKCKKP